jgi:hypothetical protein
MGSNLKIVGIMVLLVVGFSAIVIVGLKPNKQLFDEEVAYYEGLAKTNQRFYVLSYEEMGFAIRSVAVSRDELRGKILLEYRDYGDVQVIIVKKDLRIYWGVSMASLFTTGRPEDDGEAEGLIPRQKR